MGLKLPLQVGLIGLGRMGAEPSARLEGKLPSGWLPLSHAEAIQSTEGLKLAAICDQNLERLDEISKYYNISNIYSDYKDLIDSIKPSIISIATRTSGRCEIINHAIAQGVKGIYIEKPLSRSISEARKTIENIMRENVVIAYGATRRAMPVYQKAKEIISSGELGELLQINIEFGKSALLWTLPHAIDLILFYADSMSIDWLSGICDLEEWDSKSNTVDADPKVFYAYFQFNNNVSAVLTQALGFNVRIACANGTITIHGDGTFIEINRPGKVSWYFHEQDRLVINSSKSGTQLIFEDIMNSLLLKKPIKIIKPEEILLNQQMLFGIVASSILRGIKISTQEIDDGLIITGRQGDNFA